MENWSGERVYQQGGLKSATFIALSVKLFYPFTKLSIAALLALIPFLPIDVCQILIKCSVVMKNSIKLKYRETLITVFHKIYVLQFFKHLNNRLIQ